MLDKKEVGLDTAYAISVKAELYSLIITFSILAFLSVVARLYVRIKAKNQGVEDWLVVAAMIMLFVKTALNSIMIENGLGLRAENLQPKNFEMIGKAIYAAMIEYCLAIGLVKLSILIMLRRVFDTPKMRICCNVLGNLTVIWSLLFIGLGVFQCLPVQRAWNPTVPGQCLDIKTLFIGNAIPNIVTDAVMVALPIYPVMQLRLPLSQRIAVVGIFLLGSFVCAASIYRLTTVTALNPMDIAFTLKGATIFGHVETAVAIMSACLPTLRPLFSAFLSAIGVSKGTYSDRISKFEGTRSGGPWSSKSTSGTSTQPDKPVIVVIVGRDGNPKLSTKPLPPIPPPTSTSATRAMSEVDNAHTLAGPYYNNYGRRNVDVEKGLHDDRAPPA